MNNRNSVIIKSNAYGLILILDPDMPFEQLLQDVGEKFREAARFFKNARMALTFRGRVLTRAQERQMVYAITANAPLEIICLVDEQKEEEEYYKEAVIRTLEADEENDGQFYRGTLSNGQVLEMEKSVIILGDVNPGAQVISKGNIVVLGCCMGSVYAGASGNNRCFAAALIIGAVTLAICLGGLKIGRKMGTVLAGKASILGGVILIAIGLEIFISNMF